MVFFLLVCYSEGFEGQPPLPVAEEGGCTPLNRISIEWYRGEVFMNSCELTASITALANMLADGLDDDQLNLLGVSLTQLGDTLLTIATQRSICNRNGMRPGAE